MIKQPSVTQIETNYNDDVFPLNREFKWYFGFHFIIQIYFLIFLTVKG